MPRKNNRIDTPFIILMLYLFFDYGRPQAFFPIIGKLHPGYILHLSLLWLLFKENKLFNIEDTQVKAFILILAIMIIHIPFSENNYWAFEGWRNTFLYFIVFMSIISFITTYEQLEKFIKRWLMIMIFCSIVGIKSGGKVPNSPFMGDENDFALVMNMAIGMSYFMYFYSDTFSKKIFYLFAIVLFLWANIASLSRGGFVGLIGTAFYIWFRSPKKMITTIFAVLFAIIFASLAPSSYWKEMKTIRQEGIHKGTGGARWYLWKCAWKMFLHHPIIGVGQNNFPWTVGKYEPKEEQKRYAGRSHVGRVCHSLYFTILSELGALGTFLYFLIFFKSRKDLIPILKYEYYYSSLIENLEIHLFFQKLRYIVYGVECSLAAYFWTGIFLTVCYYPHFWVFNGLMIAIRNVLNNTLIEFQSKKVLLFNEP